MLFSTFKEYISNEMQQAGHKKVTKIILTDLAALFMLTTIQYYLIQDCPDPPKNISQSASEINFTKKENK